MSQLGLEAASASLHDRVAQTVGRWSGRDELPDQFAITVSNGPEANSVTVDRDGHVELVAGIPEIVPMARLDPRCVADWLGGEPTLLIPTLMTQHGFFSGPLGDSLWLALIWGDGDVWAADPAEPRAQRRVAARMAETVSKGNGFPDSIDESLPHQMLLAALAVAALPERRREHELAATWGLPAEARASKLMFLVCLADVAGGRTLAPRG
jgi:hypothetical protein